jgi:DNA end-binding protein Ku
MDKGLVGTTLRYPYELRDSKAYFSDIRTPRIARDMVDLAGHILDSKAAHFDPAEFKDEYENALKALVRRKAKGHTIAAPEPREEPSNVINLMDALRQSLATERGGKGSHGRAKRRPSKRRSRRKAA